MTSTHTKSKPYFQARRITHANLFVSNLDQSMDFYKNIVGLHEVYRKAPDNNLSGPPAAGFLSNGNTHHDVAVVARAPAPGLNHLAFELESESDLLLGYNLATSNGESFRPHDADIVRSLYHRDPDGNGVEVYSDSTKEWRELRGDGRIVREAAFPWTPGDPPRFGPANARNYHESPDILWVENAVFHPKKFTHAVILTHNIESLSTYYSYMMGFKPVCGSIEKGHITLGGTTGGHQLTLFRAVNDQETGLHHFGFEVWSENDLANSERNLQNIGIAPESTIDNPKKRSLFLRDPDGFLIEFYVNRSEESSHDHYTEHELTPFLM